MRSWRWYGADSTRRGSLGGGEYGVQRLARRHEQAVALRSAEAHVAADLRKANAAEELALRRPDGDAAVTDGASCVARAPEIAVDVGAYAVGTALDAVDHEIAEGLAIRQAIVGAHVEDVHVAFAAGVRVARSL